MKGNPQYRFSKEELDWVAANLEEAQGWAGGTRTVRWTLVITVVTGLVIHALGFALGTGALMLPAGWPADLLASLLSSLGVALWTSVIIVLFLDVIPSWQRRQAQAWTQGALAVLRERDDEMAATIDAASVSHADPVAAKLDTILERLSTLEATLRDHGSRSE